MVRLDSRWAAGFAEPQSLNLLPPMDTGTVTCIQIPSEAPSIPEVRDWCGIRAVLFFFLKKHLLQSPWGVGTVGTLLHCCECLAKHFVFWFLLWLEDKCLKSRKAMNNDEHLPPQG